MLAWEAPTCQHSERGEVRLAPALAATLTTWMFSSLFQGFLQTWGEYFSGRKASQAELLVGPVNVSSLDVALENLVPVSFGWTPRQEKTEVLRYECRRRSEGRRGGEL